MPFIRIKYNFNTVTLNEHGLLSGHKSVCGDTVEVLQRNGDSERYRFLGFRDYSLFKNTLLPLQFVKIWNVSAYYKTDFAPADFISKDHYCIGLYEPNEKGVFLLLDNESVMTRPRTKTKPIPTVSNVIPIHRHS